MSLRGSPARVKPRLRGVSHQVAFFAFLAANAVLMSAVEGSRAQLTILIYGASLAFLYGVSTLYHRPTWGPVGRRRMRSLDHSAIFVMIAGSYAPVFLLLLPEDYEGNPLLVMSILAGLGVAKSLIWAHGPKWITAVLAIAVGWSLLTPVIELIDAMGTLSFVLLVLSGFIYSVGGIVYALKRPDPFPTVFGYHEVFHALVILAGLVHYVHVLLVLDVAGAL